jgi:hypothetical protein
VRNWQEIRLKNKFLRVHEKEEKDNNWAFSMFYYRFEIEEDGTELHIGIHQEDDRILGADRRRPLDISYILFRVNEDGELDTVKAGEFVLERECQDKIDIDTGEYILVPLTTGALLQKPKNAKKGKIDHCVEFRNITMPHPFFLTTLNDLFRKIDLAINQKLSADELNQFGRIVHEKKLTSIKQRDFTNEDFQKLS